MYVVGARRWVLRPLYIWEEGAQRGKKETRRHARTSKRDALKQARETQQKRRGMLKKARGC